VEKNMKARLKLNKISNKAGHPQACNSNLLGGSNSSQAKKFVKPYLENTQHKKGLAEWLKW
jgi:hypothetical protein